MDRFDPLRGCEIAETPQRDYAYRISVDGDLWPGMVAELAREQTWSNFKSEVARFGGRDGYERALHKIWGVMYDFQEQNKR